MKLRIDGREVDCRDGATILEAARGAGLFIPSLCDHPGLEPFAGCRICLVEVEGRRDFAPACATAAEEGQVVRTRTPEIEALRKRTLEFILVQHPYACLVCPEKTTCDDLKSTIRKTGEVTGCVLCPSNGRCELQKVAADVGLERVDLPASTPNLDVHKEDPFFDRDHNLCILCGRCIRVCEEVRGAAVLSFLYRGAQTLVGTAVGRTLLETGCQFCGACVDVCPTGALFERAVKPQVRPTGTASIVCPFCGQGCVLGLGLDRGRVLESKPLHAAPHRGQGCVKGRFLVRGALAAPDRILAPHVRKDGKLEPASWDEALDRAAAGLRAASAGRTALVAPSQVALEDMLLFHEFGRDALKAGAMTAEPAGDLEGALHLFEDRHGFALPAARDLDGIASSGAVLAWNVNLPRDHPIAWLKVVQAARAGAAFVGVGSRPGSPVLGSVVDLALEGHSPAAAARLAAALLAVTGAASSRPAGWEPLAEKAGERRPAPRRLERPFQEAAALLASRRPVSILLDAAALTGPAGAETLDWLWNIAHLVGARLVPLARSANEFGVNALGLALGAPAARLGFAAVWAGLEARDFDALYLAGPFPDLGDRRPAFLVCQDTHWTRNAEQADVVLPAAAFAEAGGTWVNTEGRVRTYAPAVTAPGEARTDAAILAALAERLGRPGLAGTDRAALLAGIVRRVPALEGYDPAAPPVDGFVIPRRPSGTPRFVPVPSPLPPRGRGRARSSIPPKDVLRGFDLVAGSRGYARLRRVR